METNKKMVSMKLDARARAAIQALTEHYHLSQAAVVEAAVWEKAQRERLKVQEESSK
jgi:hypothetical protein